MRARRTIFFITALVVFATVSMVSCTDPLDEIITEEKVIATDERWDKDTRISGVVKVQNGATLTIAAGVNITFDKGASLLVGNDGKATLKIEGTESKKVYINGGEGIQLLNVTDESRISHCSISNAESSDGNALSIKMLNFPIQKLYVNGGGGVEIKEHVFGGFISGLVIESKNPIALSVPADYLNFIESLDVGSQKVHLCSGGNSSKLELSSKTTYVVTDNIELEGILTLLGVNICFGANGGLSIGNRYTSTKALIDYSTFTSLNAERWQGIVFGNKVTDNSRMKKCVVSGARVGVMLMSDQSFTILDCDFSNNDTPVQLVMGSGWDPTTIADNNTIPGGEGGIVLTSKRAPEEPEVQLGR